MPQLQPGEYTKQSAADLLGWNSTVDVPQPGTARLYYNSLTDVVHIINSDGVELLSAGGAVTSVFGRGGSVVAEQSDYEAFYLELDPSADQSISGGFFLTNDGGIESINTTATPSDGSLSFYVDSDGTGQIEYTEGLADNGIVFHTYASGGAITLNPTAGGADDGGHGVVVGNSGFRVDGRFSDGMAIVASAGQAWILGGGLSSGNPVLTLGTTGVEGVLKTISRTNGGSYTIHSPITANDNSINLPDDDGTLALTTLTSTSYSSNQNIGTGALEQVIEATGGVGGITLSTQSASLANGKIYTIKKVDSGVGSITINDTNSANYDGDSSYILLDQWQYVTIQWNGTRFNIIGNN